MSLRMMIMGVAVLACSSFAAAASIAPLPGGHGKAISISADGSAIVVDTKGNRGVLVRDGRIDSSVLPKDIAGLFPSIRGVSADGKAVLVEYMRNRSFTEISVIRDGKEIFGVARHFAKLGLIPTVMGMNADGSVVVGATESKLEGLERQAVRWKGKKAERLGTLGGKTSTAMGVSDDGSVVVGYSQNADGKVRAFRWQDGKMVSLGTIGEGGSGAKGVSGDGKTVFGTVVDGEKVTGVVWVGGKIQKLGSLGGPVCIPMAASRDGAAIVGFDGTIGGKRQAFYWTKDKGIRPLAKVLADAGVSMDGWTLVEARGISGDGKTIVGDGMKDGKQTPFVARLP